MVYRQAPRADIVYQRVSPTAVAPPLQLPQLFVAPETITSPTGDMVGEPVFPVNGLALLQCLSRGERSGYQSGNFHWNITGINGGLGIHVADSPQRGRINNFANNGTIDDALETEHIKPDIYGKRNPAWDVNTRLRYDSWQFSAEFAATVNPWPTTKTRVNAWRAETAVNIWAWGMPAALSAGREKREPRTGRLPV